MKQRQKKSETFSQKLTNWMFTLGLAFVMIFHVLSANAGCLKFAQVSDAHYTSIEEDTSYKVLKSSPEILDDVIDQINSTMDTDFVLFTGDMINKTCPNQLKEFIQKANKLDIPWYTTLGNHDVQEYVMTKPAFCKIMKENNPHINHENPYYAFSPKKGYKIICLDSIILDQITTNGRISEKQLKWLDEQLKSAKNDVVIIGLHVPVIEPYNSPSHRLLNRYEVLEILHKYKNPIIVCSGHYHGTKIIQENNVLFIDSPSLVTYPCAYRMINIHNQRKKVIVDVSTRQTKVKSALNNAKLKVMASSFLLGSEEDRNGSFEIKK